MPAVEAAAGSGSDWPVVGVVADQTMEKHPGESCSPVELQDAEKKGQAPSTSSTNQLKESMALLGLDFAEIKELTQARLSDHQNNTVQQLHEGLQQLKRDKQVLASDLRESVEALKQENSVLRAQLTKVKEDAEKRERSFTRKVQHLTDKLSAVPTMTGIQTLPASVPNPCLVPVSWSLLCTQSNNTLATPDTPTQPAANSQLCPFQFPSTQPEEQAPQVVLLEDSNGKFLVTNKLFPGKKVLPKRCSTTGQAMKLLKKNPQEPSIPSDPYRNK